MNIPLDDNRLKEAKIIVMDYSDSLDQKQRRILPRQDSEDPNVFQQRTPIASERPPAHVFQAIGQLFVYHFPVELRKPRGIRGNSVDSRGIQGNLGES